VLTWWLWVDRHSGGWVLAKAGQTIPELKAKHVKIKVESETVVFDKSKKVRWVIEASGVIRHSGETLVIDSEMGARLAELEKLAHPPVAQDNIDKLARRVTELEKTAPRSKGIKIGDTATWTGSEWIVKSS